MKKDFVNAQRYLLRSGTSSLIQLQETVRFTFKSIFVKPFDPWCEEFNKKIMELLAFGIFPREHELMRLESVEKNNQKYELTPSRLRDRPLKEDDIPLLVLTLDHLAVGFFVCALPVLISILVFLVEIFFPKLQELYEMTRLMLTFYCILKGFYSIRMN